ncbi:MAG: RNAse [Clostridiales bacterium]|nr:RNAse [Clostridiales bacterium]
MLDICLLGCGGMMPLPHRWLTALMARYNGSTVLIDCGEGTQIAIKEKGWTFKPIDVICFTHYHGDHISGLPGLLLTIGNSDRREPITLIGPKGLEKVVDCLRVIAPELPYELKFIELSEPKVSINICGLTIEAFKVNHNVTCYGYNIILNRAGKFSIDKANENSVPMKCWSKLQKEDEAECDGVTYTKDMVLGPERKGLKLTYCTDTRPTQSIIESAENADIFICEGMYGEKEKEKQAKEYKHMTFYEAANLAKKANVNELWLTHYSPSLIHPEEYMNDVRKIFANAIAGKDRMSTTLDYTIE